MRRLRDLLPKGQTLPDESWEQRHRWMVNLLWFHVAGLFAFSLLQGFPVWHSALDAAPVAAAAIVERFADGRKLRSAIVATGLLTASALVVHVSGGYVEAHFHFFVMIVVLTLYEDWIPFLLATFYVVLHHGIGSSVGSGHLVFRDADHIAHPWKWAGIHAAFVAAAGLASIVSWRLNERVRESQSEALEAARESEERFRSSFDDAVIGMCLSTPDGRLSRVNPAFCHMLGRTREELEGMTWAQITAPEDLRDSRALLEGMLSGGDDRGHGEKRYLHADGHPVWASMSARLVRRENGEPLHFITQIQDISAQKAAADALAHQALHDPLTGLPNRTLFNDRLEHALARSRRNGGRLAVVFIDVDRFKVVNDSLGHESGDWLLQQMGSRLAQAIRASDSVARFGGDEFVVLFDQVADERTAMLLTDRVRRELERPFSLEGDEDFYATVSLGVALSGPTTRAVDLVRDADAAMYRAKAAGGADAELFDFAMRDAAVERLRTERALRRGLLRDELRLHYQPIWSLESREVVAVEALVRWERPGHELVPPGAFIGVAEEVGLMQQLGEWVLREACRQAAAWRAELGPDAPLPIHVNVSSRELEQPDLPGVVARALADAGLDPADLVLEITESGLLERTQRPVSVLRAIKETGVRIALDDFGTGYSSLSYLERFPIDELKLDREFIARMASGDDDPVLVRAILDMAHALGLVVVAEGIETEEQATVLRELGCERAQGYALARPAAAEAVAELVSPARAVPSSAPRR
jgi:diguanylate cyclase (GGDEF)-like protein/PAS domain S-box-containing protein